MSALNFLVPGSILGAEDTVVNKTERLDKTEILFPELTLWWREKTLKIYTHTDFQTKYY